VESGIRRLRGGGDGLILRNEAALLHDERNGVAMSPARTIDASLPSATSEGDFPLGYGAEPKSKTKAHAFANRWGARREASTIMGRECY
jgi:hypothetical protein